MHPEDDPVHQYCGQWYYFDETGERTGPFADEAEARKMLRQYVESLFG